MKNVFIIFFIIIINICNGQEPSVNIRQYYSFCKDVWDYELSKQKIDSVYQKENIWIIEATVRDKCITRLYPQHEIVNDTLKIKMLEITEYRIELENGDSFIEVLDQYDCTCVYNVKMEFYIQNINHLEINGIKKNNAFKN